MTFEEKWFGRKNNPDNNQAKKDQAKEEIAQELISDFEGWNTFTQKIKPLQKNTILPNSSIKQSSHVSFPERLKRQENIQQKNLEHYLDKHQEHVKSWHEHRDKKVLVRFYSQKDIRGIVTQATFDLHGLTLNEAYPKLYRFLQQAQIQGKRWICVITGKGRTEEALRYTVRQWFQEWKGMVIGYAEAPSNHGGSGALWVHVRKDSLTF